MRPRSATWIAVSALAAGTVLALAPVGASAQDAVHPVIHRGSVYGALPGAKGGIGSPYVYCSDEETSPVVTWRVTNLRTDDVIRKHWTGGAYYMLRVPAGRYVGETTARCGESTDTRTDAILVREKSDATTISRAEFDRIRKGMTESRVADIVGYRGDLIGTFDGTTYRTYEKMPFAQWCQIQYRDGRVTVKEWVVEGVGG